MEVSEKIILDLVKQGEHNSTKLDSTLSAVESINDRIDGLTKNMKEMHKELGAKATLDQWLELHQRIKLIEDRYKIKLAWFNAWDTFVTRLRGALFVFALGIASLYVFEKKESIYKAFESSVIR